MSSYFACSTFNEILPLYKFLWHWYYLCLSEHKFRYTSFVKFYAYLSMPMFILIYVLSTIPLSPIWIVFIKENENSLCCESTISQWQLTPIYHNRLISQIEQLLEKRNKNEWCNFLSHEYIMQFTFVAFVVVINVTVHHYLQKSAILQMMAPILHLICIMS